jgi:hypothetical protein
VRAGREQDALLWGSPAVETRLEQHTPAPATVRSIEHARFAIGLGWEQGGQRTYWTIDGREVVNVRSPLLCESTVTRDWRWEL